MLSDLSEMFTAAVPATIIFTRIVGLFVSAPIIGGRFAPMRVKAMLALAITICILPNQIDRVPEYMNDHWSYMLALVREFMVGATMGILMNLYFSAIRFGGDLVGRTAGYAAAEIFNPAIDEMEGPIGKFFELIMVLLFLMGDGHLYFIAALHTSFAVIPIGSWSMTTELHQASLYAAKQMFTIALAIAFPVLSTTLAVTVAEGVIARAVPQINILMISFALKIMVFMIVMYTGLPLVVAFIGLVIQAMQRFINMVILS